MRWVSHRQVEAHSLSVSGILPRWWAVGARAQWYLWAHRAGDTGDKTLFLLLVDDKSRFMWLILLQVKSEAAEAIRRIQARAEAKCGKKMWMLHMDWGREFTSTSFNKYCDELGIQRQLTTPYSPQVERGGRTPKSDHHRDSKVIAHDRRDAWEVFGEAVMTTVYLQNRSPTRSLNRKMPHEAWYNKQPAVHHLRVFGWVTYIEVAHPHLGKLDPRGWRSSSSATNLGANRTGSMILWGGEITCLATSSSMKTPSGSGTMWLRQTKT